MPLPGENAMNLRKLPREKRNKLFAVVAGTLVTLAGLYFGLIQYQEQNLVHLAQKKVAVEARHRQVLDAIKHAHQIETDLATAKKTLAEAEIDIASGDLYSWVVNTLRDFKAKYKVNIPQFNLDRDRPGDCQEDPRRGRNRYRLRRLVLLGCQHAPRFQGQVQSQHSAVQSRSRPTWRLPRRPSQRPKSISPPATCTPGLSTRSAISRPSTKSTFRSSI